ncbi:MAG: N-acetyl sugar amidotransferase [Peptococcaceae bacterium BICA1-7]|nr:MAG: N-acetyl sugar amidotransferase [Peptococcaceae bacterium BICA1-7]
MRYCKNCLMPDTKPGLILDDEGICQACRHYAMRKNADYEKRFEMLKSLCDKYRRNDGYYDCIVSVSGGKDSHFQVYVMKELLGMNPLLVSVSDPFTHTSVGEHNIRNITEAFGCDIITLNTNPVLVKRMMRIAFEELGSPTWPIDRPIYVFPIRMAINMKIPMVIYGENVSWEYGGVLSEETYSAKDQINNDVAKKVDFSLWLENGVKRSELSSFIYPTAEEIEKAGLEPIYLSYFIPWDGYNNYEIAKRYGFRDLTHEWKRGGYIEDYDQIDSIGYLINVWMKYPKFGFARATDVVGYWIRSGKIDRETGKRLIVENDYMLDTRVLDDFLQFAGYTDREFWSIVDKFYNRDLFEKIEGVWKLKKRF